MVNIHQGKLSIPIAEDNTESHELNIPVYIPNIELVREFALLLHHKGEAWQGIFQGWDAEYKPQMDCPLPGSNAPFDPAYFVIGDSRLWMYAIDWENGKDNAPSSEVNDIEKIIPVEIDMAGDLVLA